MHYQVCAWGFVDIAKAGSMFWCSQTIGNFFSRRISILDLIVKLFSNSGRSTNEIGLSSRETDWERQMPLITQPLLISLPLLLLISRSNAETRPLISPRGCYPDPSPPRSITFLKERCSFLLPVWDTMPPLVRFLLSFIIARSQTRAGHMRRTLSKWFVPFLLTRLIFSRMKLKPNTNCAKCKNVGIKIHFLTSEPKLGWRQKKIIWSPKHGLMKANVKRWEAND